MTAVAIINSGGANIASLRFAFERLGVATDLTTDPDVISNAERVLLPGVGAAKDAMQRLQQAKLVDVIRNLSQPVLGICLGMQLLFEHSEEEDVVCLGVIPGSAQKLPATPDCTVPNMGWCETTLLSDHALLQGIDDGSFFYYLHSYAVPASQYSLATAEHAATFTAISSHRNFMAAQFHPERSSAAGARLLQNFLSLSL